MVAGGPARGAAGDLDTSFGSAGKVVRTYKGDHTHGNDVALQDDGKIVVAGYSGARDDMAVARFTASGKLDDSFSKDGWAFADFGVLSYGSALAIDGEGRIVVVGYAIPDSFDVAVARWLPNGRLDTSFGGDGTVIVHASDAVDEATAVAVMDNGKIVLTGTLANGDYGNDVLAVRLTASGSPDASFDDDGIATVNTRWGKFDNGFDWGNAIALQGRKVVIAGRAYGSSKDHMLLARFLGDGTLDPTFGGAGKAVPVFTVGASERLDDMIVNSKGQVVAVGTTSTGGGPRLAVIRVADDGTLDPGFSGDGKLAIEFSDALSLGYARLTQQGTKLLLLVRRGALSGDTTAYELALCRITLNGAIDTGFGIDGQLITDAGTYNPRPGAVSPHPGGRFVVTGVEAANEDDPDSVTRMILARFLSY